MTLAELAQKAAELPPRSAFEWSGAEQFHDDVFEREVRTLPQAIAYIDRLRKRMAEYAHALDDICDGYDKMRELLLTFHVERRGR